MEAATKPKQLVVDSDLTYLEAVRECAARKHSGEPIQFALYGPQAHVPEGVLHFDKATDIADYIRQNDIKAIISSAYAEKAEETMHGPRLGVALEKDLRAKAVRLHLHSSQYDKLDRTHYKDGTSAHFSGISPKGSPDNTLKILDNIAQQFIKVPSPKKEAPATTIVVKEAARDIPNVRFMTIDLNIDVSDLDKLKHAVSIHRTCVGEGDKYPGSLEFNRFEYMAEHVAEIIPSFQGDSRIQGILIGVNPGLDKEQAITLAEHARAHHIPVICVHKGELSHEDKALLEEAGAVVVPHQKLPEAIKVIAQEKPIDSLRL